MPEPAVSRTTRFLRGVAFNLLGHFSSLLLVFFLTPFLIHQLTPEAYALYAFFGLFVGYLFLLTLGAGNAAQKYVAEFQAGGRSEDLRRLMWYMWGLHTVGVAAGAALLALGSSLVVRYFMNVPDDLAASARWMVVCAAVAAVFFAWTQWCLSVLRGLQKFGLSNLFSFLQAAAPLAGSAILLKCGYGLKVVGVWLVAGQFLAAAMGGAALLFLVPEWRGGPVWPSSERRRAFFRFGWFMFLTDLGWVFVYQLDKMCVTYFLPLAALTYYAVPFAMVQKLGVVPGAISNVVFSMFSELQGLGSEEKMRRVYVKTSKLTLLVILPFYVLLFVFAPQFLTLWLGVDFGERSTWPLRWVLLGQLCSNWGNIAVILSGGMGRPDYGAKLMWSIAAVCGFLWFILIPSRGIAGAAFAFFAAQALCTPFLVLHVTRRMAGITLREYLEQSNYSPFVAAGALLGMSFVLRPYADGWPSLMMAGFFCGAFYLSLSYVLLEKDEKEIILKQLSG
ncbi:MAG: oligosaccharide flippase family protein [Elusimicrobia bacterium]|nr:oligosaccharide flippase family protein [Elusimicrobiota bacterium]